MGLEVQQYLSVMSPAASAGPMALTLQTYGLPTNVTLTLSVSGIAGTETTKELANKVWTQWNTYLTQNNKQFQNVPPQNPSSTIQPFLSFPDQYPAAKWNPTWADHVVCLASQCDFEMRVDSNTTGALLDIDTQPTLVDLADGAAIISDNCIIFEDSTGSPLTSTQIARRLKYGSAKLSAHLRNNIVISTYIENYLTTGTDSVQVDKTPMKDFFAPVIRRPIVFSINALTANATVKSNFWFDSKCGILYYAFAQNLIYNVEPFDEGNSCILAYMSGYYHIPSIIKEMVVRVAALASDIEFEELRAQGSAVKYWGLKKIYEDWAIYLSEYYCR